MFRAYRGLEVNVQDLEISTLHGGKEELQASTPLPPIKQPNIPISEQALRATVSG
jgi:hypothetical protein